MVNLYNLFGRKLDAAIFEKSLGDSKAFELSLPGGPPVLNSLHACAFATASLRSLQVGDVDSMWANFIQDSLRLR